MGKTLDKLKEFVGYDIEEEELNEEEIEYEEYNAYDEKDIESTRSNVVNIDKNKDISSRVRVIIYEPSSYDDLTHIIDEVRNKKIIVMNMLRIEGEIKQKIFYGMGGAVYALDGSMEKVAKDIFVIAPKNVSVDSKKLSEEMANRGFLRGRM